MTHYFKLINSFTLLLFFSFSVSAKSLDNSKFIELMQLRLNVHQDSSLALVIGSEKLLAARAIRKMYLLNGFNPLWNQAATNQLLNSINEAVTLDGLREDDYMLPGFKSLVNGLQLNSLSAKQRVDYELVLTESFLRLSYHLRFGKVNPVSLDSNWNYGRRLDFKDPLVALSFSIIEQNISSILNQQRPTHLYYHKLRQLLGRYRKLAAEGGWKKINNGPAIKPGYRGTRVSQVKARLKITGDFFESTERKSTSLSYSEDVQQAIIGFQKRQGLDADGKVGKNTIRALNRSVNDRIEQIRVNLERLRWIMHEVEDDFLLVDIPGFEIILVQNGQKQWQGKIQVGEAFSATPVFKGTLEYLEFNPTWTIPPSIIEKKILPRLKNDPGYLDKKGYFLLDFSGNKIDPQSIDWKTIKGFPYMVRQPAGNNNALGLVKFIFPNPHFVFLHDTNHKELFSRNSRTFSAGCIRVEKPFELSEYLLKTTKGWERKDIAQLITSGETKRVHPKDNISVLITYTTVGIDEQGQARFKPDVYNRDNTVLEALNGKIKIAKDVRKALRKFTLD